MFVVSYRYRVPSATRAAYLDLQRRVAEAYLAHGCRRYLVLEPADRDGLWTELSCFPDRHTHVEAERRLEQTGALGALFDEFLRVTGARTEDLVAEEYVVAGDISPNGGPG